MGAPLVPVGDTLGVPPTRRSRAPASSLRELPNGKPDVLMLVSATTGSVASWCLGRFLLSSCRQ